MLNILQVNTFDIHGGAEKIAWSLHQSFRFRGHNAWLAVGTKHSDSPHVVSIPNDAFRNPWARFWLSLSSPLSALGTRNKGVKRLHKLLNYTVGQPCSLLELLRGHENYDFPATAKLLTSPLQKPHILHCHNLHGNYFDLRMLPYLSQQVPLVMTLHDAWLLSGHCAHSFDCDRWQTGCGQCPDLSIYPAILRDETVYNWQRKRAIYSNSKLYIATPSRWLMNKVEQSMLNSSMIEGRVIPNGIDLSIFHPANKQLVRTELGIPQDAKVLLFTASGIRNNVWKDYQTMRTALGMLAEQMEEEANLLFIALGEDSPTEYIGQAKIQFVPFQKEPTAVARYYQAADIYVHAVRAETFGLVIAEALACGTPVVATAVGSIPELVDDESSGFLVKTGDAAAMAASIQKIFKNPKLQQEMGTQAADVARRFCLEKMVDDYLSWYQEILSTSIQLDSHTSEVRTYK